MTDQTPQEQMKSKIDSLRSTLNDLQSEVRFNTELNQVAQLDTQVNGLDDRVQALRVKGYVFNNALEKQAAEFSKRWQSMSASVKKQIGTQAPALTMELTLITTVMGQVEMNAFNPAMGLPMADQFERNLKSFEEKVEAAQRSIRSGYEQFQREIGEIDRQIDRIEWTLKQLDEGCVKLLATEGCIMAVKARFARDERMAKDDPQGVLFLTDQRLIFEQNEEVATKKVLFITTEKKKVQQVLLEAPIGLVETMEATKKGLFKNEDHLSITFRSGAPVHGAWFHLDGQDCAEWKSMINRACSGGYVADRAVGVDQAAAEKVRQAPSKCPNCGAPVTQQVLRGMDTLTCEYCQFVMRL